MSYNSALTNSQIRKTPLVVTDADKLILVELRVISLLLQIGLNVNESLDALRTDIANDMFES